MQPPDRRRGMAPAGANRHRDRGRLGVAAALEHALGACRHGGLQLREEGVLIATEGQVTRGWGLRRLLPPLYPRADVSLQRTQESMPFLCRNW